MKKYKFSFADENKSVDEFIIDFKAHLKKRSLTLEEIKKDTYKMDILDYFNDVIHNKNINALKAFKELGFMANNSYFSLAHTIYSVIKYESRKQYFEILSEMGFFKNNIVNREPLCVLSNLLYENNEKVIKELVDLGYPKILTGKYIPYLLRENKVEDIKKIINEDYIYSLSIFNGTERSRCNSLKEVERKKESAYLILDNASDDMEIKKKYALDFLERIVHSNHSNGEMIKEYIEKYNLEVPYKNFSFFFNNEVIKDINKEYGNKFIIMYKNKAKNSENDNLMSLFFKFLIKNNIGEKFIIKCLQENIDLQSILKEEMDSMIVESLIKGYSESMKMIMAIEPLILEKTIYKDLSSLSIDKFIKKNLLSNGFRLDLDLFKKYRNFINDYFCNEECVNLMFYYTMTSTSQHAKDETLFTMAAHINDAKLTEKIINVRGFDLGMGIALYASHCKSNFDVRVGILKKMTKKTKMKGFDLNYFKENVREIANDPIKFSQIINSGIEKNILQDSLKINAKKPSNKKRM